MTAWERVFGRVRPTTRAGPDEPAEPAGGVLPLDTIVEHATDFAAVEDALRRAEGTAVERRVLDALARRRVRTEVPESVRALAGILHARRGERGEALRALEACREPASLVLAADLEAEGANHRRALALIDRALSLDFTTPGALDRRRTLARVLGLDGEAHASVHATLRLPGFRGVGLVLTREVGRGGSGTVFEATDEALGRRVALKVYHRPEHDREKLVREARTAVRLAGDGVVRVFDADPAAGHVVMEWARGGSLADLLRRDGRAAAESLNVWFRPLVAAVSRVHEARLVHGDIKPANVLFRGEGEPVVADFGSAVEVGAASPGTTAAYASPERLAGAPASTADDVHALGVVLDEVLRAVPADGERAWSSRRDLLLSADRPESAAALLAILGR